MLIGGDSIMQAVVHNIGGADGLRVEKVPKPSVQEEHLLIEVHYFAINRADILQRKGLYPPPKGETNILGLEASGVIQEISSSCSKPWRLVKDSRDFIAYRSRVIHKLKY